MRPNFWLSLTVGLCFATGCSRQQSAADSAPQKTSSTAAQTASGSGGRQKLADDAVLIRYGTNEFTMGEAKKLAGLRVKMMQMSMPKGQDVKPNDALLARILAAVPFGFPRDCAVREFAEANGIKAGKREIDLMRSRAMQSAKQGFLSWPSFARKLTETERKTLNERIQIEALTESVRQWHAKNKPAKVTNEELAQFRSRQRSYNKMAAATNDFTFAQATNIWRDIQGGRLAFEDAVQRYSNAESDSETGEWGDFAWEYFKDEPVLRSAIEKLDPGQISPPVEGDNGLMIIRLDDKRTEGNGETVYTLSRVFFHLPEFYPELDDATFAKEIREARQNRLFNDFVTELSKKKSATYPNGEQIFENAKRTASQPALF